MPMSDSLRRQYREQSGMTRDEVREQVGTHLVDTRTASEGQPGVEETLARIHQLVADTQVISAKYHALASGAGRDARNVVEDAELETDRELLREIMAPEYKFTSPFGATSDRDTTINTMLSGTIRPQTTGRDGYEASEVEFVLSQDTAVLVSTVRMNATGLTVHPETRELGERDLSGTYRQTHTFAGSPQWHLVSTQMTPLAEPELQLAAELDEPVL